MDELISRQRMKNMITNHWSDFSNATNYRTALACVDAVPTINPGPKRGKWINIVDGIEYTWGTCDKCGARIPMVYNYYEFCPHCGTENEVTT